MEEYYSHVRSDKKENITDHLRETAALAKTYAAGFGSRIAEQTGLLHDLGKRTENS